MILMNMILFGLIGGGITFASFQLHSYIENKKIEQEYQKIIETYLNCNNNDKMVVDYSEKIEKEYEPFRVIKFVSLDSLDSDDANQRWANKVGECEEDDGEEMIR